MAQAKTATDIGVHLAQQHRSVELKKIANEQQLREIEGKYHISLLFYFVVILTLLNLAQLELDLKLAERERMNRIAVAKIGADSQLAEIGGTSFALFPYTTNSYYQ